MKNKHPKTIKSKKNFSSKKKVIGSNAFEDNAAQQNILGVFYQAKLGKKALNQFGYVYPLERGRTAIALSSIPDQINEEDVVLVKYGNKGQIEIIEKLGSINDPSLFSLISIHKHQLPHIFSAKALKEADKESHNALSPSLGFEDYRDYPLMTIDGEDAKDFDDAVWAEQTPNGWRIVVAIADVTYYVKSFTHLDKEAFERGNSTYFPDRVVPMLPPILSDDCCSLRPMEDKASLLVDLKILDNGSIQSYTFKRALIQSKARLTYNQVEQIITKEKSDIKSPDDSLKKNILPLLGAYQSLRKGRLLRGALNIESDEKKIVFDHNGEIKDILPRERLTSHQIIEEFMIVANVCAAKTLLKQKKQGFGEIYRTHAKPELTRIENLKSFLKRLKFNWPKDQSASPHFFNSILEKASGTPFARLINELVLRCQSQAIYSPENTGHYGLGLAHYCHFTSPIRRYADLMVHRALIHHLNLHLTNEKGKGDAQEQPLETIAKHISWTERRSAQAERETTERYMASYYEKFLGHSFTSVIVSVHSLGLFVELPESGAEGLIPYDSLRGDHFILDEKNHRYLGKRTKTVFELGQKINVLLEKVDKISGKLRFSLIAKEKAVNGTKSKPTENKNKDKKKFKKKKFK